MAESAPSVTPTVAPKPLTIVLTGGGSGGHIMPVLAVAAALKNQMPACRLIYVGQKGDKLGDLVRPGGVIDEVTSISGGKWRRYHGERWRQLLDIPTLLKNIRDVFRILLGTLQARRVLKKVKADGVFIKGGVPLGWAARICHVPYVTLDLDALPSLANRLIAKNAAAHAVAMPREAYPYPPDKTFYVGVPLAEQYQAVTEQQRAAYRAELKISADSQVILATGGGLGANGLNIRLAQQMPVILKQYPRAVLVHATGREHEAKMNKLYDELLEAQLRPHVIVRGFIEDMYRYTGAADMVIARAGATTLAELALQGKACIIVPNPVLTGGHQLKNADQLAAHGAIIVVPENDAGGEGLRQAIIELLGSPDERARLANTLRTFAQPDAADKLAKLLIKTFNKTINETSTQ